MIIDSILVSGLWAVLLGVIVWALYITGRAYIDPLRDIDGPFIARFTRLWYLKKIFEGKFELVNVALHKKYGPVVRIAPNVYSIDDPGCAKTLYGHGSKFVKASWYSAWMPLDINKASLFGDTDPHHHALQRRKFASSYSMTSLVGYEPFVNNCTKVFTNRLSEIAKLDETIDLAHWFQCYAFDVIGKITFGRRFGFLDYSTRTDVFDAIDTRNLYSTFVGLFPSWLHRMLFPLLPTTGGHGYVGKYTMDEIASRESLLKSPDVKEREGKPDFVSRFFQICEEDPENMTKTDIFTMCQSNIGAGSDTTAISLSAIVYNLLKHPETYTRLKKEIDEAASQGKIADPISFKETQELPFLQAVIKEALRLHSATGLPLARVVPEGGAMFAGKQFPAGATVGINSWVAHRNTNIFGADADSWRPERWLDEHSNDVAEMDRYFLAFGLGSRTCLGKNLIVENF
uniref:Pisatin demethylase n=1 Tax=Talaromyces marneffei PM1 TaxID=1077442 RepID=A0A093Y5K2_TALMA